MDTEKIILARGYNKRNERISVIEIIEKDEMTCAGIFLIIDGEKFEYAEHYTALTTFNKLIAE